MTRRLWIAPDGENILIGFLHSNLDVIGAAGVSSVKPLQDRWVQVRATGGQPHSMVADWVQLTITAWARRDDWDAAHQVMGVVRGLIEEAAEHGDLGGTPCYGGQVLAVPYNDPDPVTGVPRVTMTVRLALRGRYVEVENKGRK